MSSKIKITSIFVVFILILLATLPGVFAVLNIDFVVDGDAESTAIEQEDPITLEYDSTKNYYYVEMGTYGGSPVRWRYVADVTNGVASATRFVPTSTNAPDTTTGKGMFILESDIFTADTLINGTTDTNDGILEFLPLSMMGGNYHSTSGFTDIKTNDYAASNLRAFLTGKTNVAGENVGNLMNVIGIDSSNPVYQRIIGRTLSDLYSAINKDGTSLSLPSQFKSYTTDKFWSLSYNEALTILGGGQVGQNELRWASPAFRELNIKVNEQTEESLMNAWYWLRSPNLSITFQSYFVGNDGNILDYWNIEVVNAVRPAFILNFEEPELVQYDETENYYYLEMGYHNGNPVRWRYVADVTNGVASAKRFVPSSTNAPDTTKGKGMFILETCLVDSVSTITSGASSSTQDHIVTFQNRSITSGNNIYVKKSDGTASTILSNDYAASDVREFLTASNGGTNAISGQAVGNFMDLIGIDETNYIYKRIVGRTLNDLYSEIGISNTTSFTPTFNSVPSQFSGQIRDKFWVPSANEAYRILGGNTNGGNEMPWENDAYYEYLSGIGWSSSECNAIYWLRTPGGNDYVYNISGGKIVSNWLANTNRTVRPAFVLNFDEEGTIQYDTFDNYYYMEMGSYNGSAVRWRYVADTTNGIDVATRFVPSSTNAPDMSTGRKGMFILESEIFNCGDINVAETQNDDGVLAFLPSSMYSTSTNRHTTAGYTNVVLNDYAASNVRAFLTGRNNVAGNSVGDLMDVIGISSNNPVYKKIQGRTLSDLYSKIAVTETTTFTTAKGTIPSQFSGSEVDMFWSLSINEAYRILGGNTDGGNEMKWNSPNYQKYYGKAYYGDYWLRSPRPNNDYAVFQIYSQGKFTSDVINYEHIAARPAFIYQF